MGRVPSKWHFHRLLCQKRLPGYFFVQFLCNLLGLNPNAKIISIGTTTLQRTRWLILKWYLVLQFYYCLLATSFQGCANICPEMFSFGSGFMATTKLLKNGTLARRCIWTSVQKHLFRVMRIWSWSDEYNFAGHYGPPHPSRYVHCKFSMANKPNCCRKYK